MCGPRLYHLETNAGGQVAHSLVGENDVKPQVSLRTLNPKYAGKHTIFIRTTLKEYPHRTVSQSFDVTFYWLREQLKVTDKYH